jgi:ADP-ribosyl-[dinitrogen reductase] hydrolase
MNRFVGWYRRGENSATGRCFDIGNATREALVLYERTGEPYSGSANPETAGNGSIMRLAPVPIRWAHDPETAVKVAADQSLLTHAAPEAVAACELMAEIMCGAIVGDVCAVGAKDHWPEKIRQIAGGAWRNKSEQDISSSGYVVHTLEAALWCIAATEDFESAVIKAVNLADDADTVGAVTGQIAGAIYGYEAIPDRWLDKLAWHGRILELADKLAGSAL